MTDFRERVHAVNQDLRALDDAHRLGRINRAEYRARRRRLLETLYDPSAVITARNTLVPPVATVPRARSVDDVSAVSGDHALTSLLSMRPATRWRTILVTILLGAVLLAAVAYWTLRR